MHLIPTPLVLALLAPLAPLAPLADLAAQAPGRLATTSAGGLVAEAPGCTSRFDEHGATLSSTVSGPEERALRLRLTDWGRRTARRSVATPVVHRAGNDRMHYVHDGIVERYRTTPDGFEQSFVLERRPEGSGDLVLGIAAQSEHLHAPAASAAHQALQFRSADGVGVHYGEAFAIERGRRPVPVLTRYDGEGRIELIVPEALVDAASYPLVVDPAVSPLFNPGGAGSQDDEPDAAQALLAGRYMVVWRRTISGNGVIRAQVWNDDATPVSGVVQVTTTGDAADPTVVHTVVGGVDRFCVVYERNNRIEARLYDLSGNPVTSAVPVTNPAVGVAHHRPSASAMDDTGVMVAWDSTPPPGPFGPSTPNQLEVQLLSFANGTIYGGVVHVIDSIGSGFTRRIRLAKSHMITSVFGQAPGTQYVATRAVWERSQPISAASPTEVWTRSFALLAPSGLQYVPLSFAGRVAGTSAGGDAEEQPDIDVVASTGDDPSDERFLIAWQGGPGDIRAAIYDLDGPIAAAIDVSSTGDFETEPAVLAGGCEFAVGYRRIGTTQSIQVRAFRPDGSQITTSATTLRSGTDQYYAARGASRHLRRDGQMPTNRVLFVWQDSGGPSTGVWDVRARFYRSLSVYVAPYGSGCAGPGGTLPQISALGEPEPGNTAFAFRVDNAPPNTLAVLLASDQLTTTPIPGAPGCALFAGLPFVLLLPAVTNAAGAADVALPIPCAVPPGTTFAFQWGCFTPGHNAFGWIVSDDIDVAWNL